MPVRPHVIRRQILEVDVEGTESDGLALQRRLPALCQDWLMPSLEAVFDRLVPEGEYWTIDRLDIDAGSLRPEAFERAFVDAVTQEVERYLREHAPRPTRWSPVTTSRGKGAVDAIGSRSEGQVLREVFLFFLNTGMLPWWFRLPLGATLEGVIRESWEAEPAGERLRDLTNALTAVIAMPVVRTRLVRQFSPDFLYAFLDARAQECGTAVREVVAESRAAGLADPGLDRWIESVWQTAFVMWAASERPTAEILVVETAKSTPLDADWSKLLPPRFARLLRGETRDGRTDRARKDGRDTGRIREPGSAVPLAPAAGDGDAPVVDLDEGVYVTCAGMILLHPFLPRFFEALGIARDGQLLQPQRALHLLHVLATGQRIAPEYDLVVAKLLCNVPPETPVNARFELTPAEEEEISALLAALIRHWDALGDTSPDALRNTFLVRPGKISRRGGDDLLQVEARSFDILLDRLPWSIGMIQLPWMERVLWVEWLP